MNFGLIFKSFALAVNPDEPLPAFSAEAWAEAGMMTLIGMGMIFAVLAILMFVLMIFKLVFAGPTKKEVKPPKPEKVSKKSPASNATKANNDDVMSAVIAASIQAYQEDSNESIVAVITAAVAEYRAAEGLGDTGFRVVSFKRAGTRHWNSKK